MKKRPRGVTFLSWLILGFSTWNFVRFGGAIYFWFTLKEYELQVSPAYVAATGLIWGLVGLSLFWGLRQGRSWTRVMVLCSAVCYAAWYWIDRLVFQTPQSNWPFALVITTTFLALHLVIIVLPNTRRWFNDKTRNPGDTHE